MTRTVLIGLDGATFSVLDPLTEGGDMPFLKEFISRGVRGELLSTPNPITAQAWPALMTGRSPGNHGIFDFVRFEERAHGAYMTVTDSRDLCCETIWSIASRQNRTVTWLNFYGTHPPRPITGYLIAGFVPWRHLKDAVYPPSLYETLRALPDVNRKELAMDLDLDKKSIQGLPREEYEDWIALHVRRDQQWAALLQHLMRTDPTDLTAIVFDGVDKLQHLCWRFLDPELLPELRSAWELKIRDLCLDYFRQMDRYIGEIVDLAGPDARVFIVSDHGFGASTELFYVNLWLQQCGYLQWADGAEVDQGQESFHCERLTEDRLKNHVSLIDWARTSAYALTPSSNGICIRVSDGSTRTGIPAENYQAFRMHLIKSLLAFTDPANGLPVVTRIQTREEAYPGNQMHLAPDLLLTLRDGGFVSILNAAAPLKARSEPVGAHRPEGIFIAKGSGIREGIHRQPLSILDVAPILLHSTGLPIPEDLEGSAPVDLFEPSFLKANPIQIGEPSCLMKPSPVRTIVSSERGEAEDEVIERLRALGYLE